MKRGVGLILAAVLAGCAGQPGDVPRVETGTLVGSGNAPRNRAKIHTDLAGLYFGRGSMSIALEELRLATAADPEYAPAYNLFGMVYAELREARLAEENFERALDLAPGDPDVNHSFGVYLCESGKPAESIKYYLQAARNPLYTSAWRAYSAAGVCALRAQNVKDAEDYFDRALKLEPDEPVSLFQLAQLRYRQRSLEEARRLVARRNRVLDPTPETLWLALRIERRLGERAAEAGFANQLRRRFPDSAEYQALRRGDYD